MIKVYTHTEMLKQYCYLSGDNDYVTVTEWANGEGITIELNSDGQQCISLTWGQYDAIKEIINLFDTLNYESKD